MRKKIISVILVVLALGIIVVSLNPRLYVGRYAQLIAQYKVKSNTKIVHGTVKIPVQYDGVSDVNLKKLRADMQRKEAVVLRGYVAIPQVGIEMPIFEGTSPKSLALGAGTLKADETMGQRNYAIGAHNMADNRTYFSTLQNEFYVGSKIYVTDGEKIYIYRSTTKKIVSEYQVNVLADKPKQTATITLVTCFEEPPYYTNATKRVIITGKLLTQRKIDARYLQAHGIFKVLQNS
ncbi:class A sortase [Periweissella cryptocerci]|uniref:Class A sortase n=1 Tax=Periweissella cryptocerci TaxID=2506420 RepID=A0A4P6YTV5_9LACO|nr:class A sortase [Periweissella cryptocerci]QBO36097.1 class A sortase [Periweissella cryptocerci]